MTKSSTQLVNFEDIQKDYILSFKQQNEQLFDCFNDFQLQCRIYQIYDIEYHEVSQTSQYTFYKKNQNQHFITDSTQIEENQILNEQITYIQIKFPSQHEISQLYPLVKVNYIFLKHGKFEILNSIYDYNKLSLIVKGIISSNNEKDTVTSISVQFNHLQFIRHVDYQFQIKETYIISEVRSLKTVNLNFFCEEYNIQIPQNISQSANFKCLEVNFQKKNTKKLLIQNILFGYAVVDNQLKQINYNTEINEKVFLFIDPCKSTKFIYTFEQGKCEVNYQFCQMANFVTQMQAVSTINGGNFVLFNGQGVVLNTAKRIIFKRDNVLQSLIFQPQNDSLEVVKYSNNDVNYWRDEISQITAKEFVVLQNMNNSVSIQYPQLIKQLIININCVCFGCDLESLDPSGLIIITDRIWSINIQFELEGIDLVKEIYLSSN